MKFSKGAAAIKFEVSDRNGYTLAEGRIERDRANARARVEAIERNMEIERLVRESARRRPTPAGYIHQRTRHESAPMATWNRPTKLFWAISAWAVALVCALNMSDRP